MTSKVVRGEQLEVPERVILAPVVGVFQPVSTAPAGTGGEDASGHGDAKDGRPEALDGDGAPGSNESSVHGRPGPEGRVVTEGQVVGIVEARGQAHPVVSAFTGFLVGLLAHPGERVREGQPVAWLRIS